MEVDLNADLGEGFDQDIMILDYVSSANIACGWHAGDPKTIYQCVKWAIERRVAIGAHPGYPDRTHFGRIEMNLPSHDVYTGILYQIGALQGIVRSQGGVLAHVKPHGALYNQAAKDSNISKAIVSAIKALDPKLKVVGLAGSELIKVARAEGMVALEEVFADRGYLANGMLAPRGTPGALIEEESLSLAQTLKMIKKGEVVAIDGTLISIRADTICLHGDGPHAVAFAKLIREHLSLEGVTVQAS
jgi:5-oxoprolinase (ATP-hydrolysing) subunit A